MGLVEEVETEEDGIGWGEYLRVRICLNISKPLVRGRVLKLNGEATWIAFQYERLPKLCFQCGVIRHSARGCLGRKPRVVPGEGSSEQFGTWLRAAPLFKRMGYNRDSNDRGVFSSYRGSRAMDVSGSIYIVGHFSQNEQRGGMDQRAEGSVRSVLQEDDV
jgi:hypothetical protein